LDHENGGDIAPQLDRIYTYLIFRLQAINIDNDVTICDELSERIGELRQSWAIIAGNEAGSEPTQVPPKTRGSATPEAIEA
jgi:flagellar protein FliS